MHDAISTFKKHWLKVLVMVSLCAPAAVGFDDRPADHAPVDAVQGVVGAFQKHPVVMIGEWVPGVHQMGEFYTRLVQDPSFQQTVQDIVVDFASRNNQLLLDRYIAGENVPADQVRRIWQDTTRAAAWDSPVYAELLATIREVNRKLPADRRFHVLAGDTAIDWSLIKTHGDWTAVGDSDTSFANVIMNQVLAKHRHALVILNGQNVAKLGHEGKPNTATMIEAKFPGAIYVVIHHRIPHDPDEVLLQLPGHVESPTLYDLAGTALGLKPDHNGVAPVRWVDAWLYVGPADATTRQFPPKDSLDASYIKEIDRRSTIAWGDLRARRFIGLDVPQ